jgi:transmembrane sensor
MTTRGHPDDIASDWIAREQVGLSELEQAQLESWAADPMHAAALNRQRRTWNLLSEPLRRGEGGGLARDLRVVAAAILTGPLRTREATELPPVAATTVAVKPDRQVLADGSAVELNSGAMVEVRYDDAVRKVDLLAGEALFEVAKNPGRPFVVHAGRVQVRAVGTAFTVRHSGDSVAVLVTEGTVAVSSGDGAEPVLLGSGKRMMIDENQAAEVADVDAPRIERELAWRNRRVEFSGTSVSDAVDFLNRQNVLQLRLEDEELAKHKLSGIFWSDDPEGFVRLLESGMNVRAVRSGNEVLMQRQR